MFAAVISLGVLAFFFGGVLAFAAEKFTTDKDPKVEAIAKTVPGINCGACGYPGCEAFAEAVAKGEAPSGGCKPGGQDVANKIDEIMSEDEVAQFNYEMAEIDVLDHNADQEKHRKMETANKTYTAKVACLGSRELAEEKYEYDGVRDCRAAMMYRNGPKACEFGCLGLGTCVEACPFDAITMQDNGLPKIDKKTCQACNICVEVCPKDVIVMSKNNDKHFVSCNSKETGGIVSEICPVGCFGCGICVEQCPVDAITIENDLAVIDPEKCVNCGLCKVKCPTECIISQSELEPGRV